MDPVTLAAMIVASAKLADTLSDVSLRLWNAVRAHDVGGSALRQALADGTITVEEIRAIRRAEDARLDAVVADLWADPANAGRESPSDLPTR